MKLLTMMKVCETSAAAAQLVSPGWLAVIVQLPTPLSVTVVPDTEQPPVALILCVAAGILVAFVVLRGPSAGQPQEAEGAERRELEPRGEPSAQLA